jgi:hypothetical protein
LFSFAKEEHISVQPFLAAEDKSIFFHVPLSVKAHDQYLLLISELEVIHPSQSRDTWGYIWGSSFFASSKAYLHLLGSIPVSPVFSSLFGRPHWIVVSISGWILNLETF